MFNQHQQTVKLVEDNSVTGILILEFISKLCHELPDQSHHHISVWYNYLT